MLNAMPRSSLSWRVSGVPGRDRSRGHRLPGAGSCPWSTARLALLLIGGGMGWSRVLRKRLFSSHPTARLSQRPPRSGACLEIHCVDETRPLSHTTNPVPIDLTLTDLPGTSSRNRAADRCTPPPTAGRPGCRTARRGSSSIRHRPQPPSCGVLPCQAIRASASPVRPHASTGG